MVYPRRPPIRFLFLFSFLFAGLSFPKSTLTQDQVDKMEVMREKERERERKKKSFSSHLAVAVGYWGQLCS